MELSEFPLKIINEARKPVLIPFPNGMYGGQLPQEERNRLDCTAEVWKCVYSSSWKKLDIISSNDLANKYGLTLAQGIANYLRQISETTCPSLGQSIVIAEEESCHTGHQARAMHDFIRKARYDLLIPISNWWHLRRILLHMKYWYEDLPILAIASLTAGPIQRRIFNAGKETLLWGFTYVFDRSGQYFDYCIEKRKQDASIMP